MGFLRRLFGGSETAPAPADRADPASIDAEERARDVELLREDHARLDDLAQRQLRYADYAWQPPAEGGDRRADDAESGREDGG